jgi:hypothetical protein
MKRNSNRWGNEVAKRILWPNIPVEFVQVVRDAVGPGFETGFCANFSDVTDEQWANAYAIARSCPPPQYRQAAQVPRFCGSWGAA